MTTQTAPAPTNIDALDFTPTCQLDEEHQPGQRIQCQSPATWVGVGPCGHDSYFCETHHSDPRPMVCKKCGNKTLLAVYRWIRL